MIKTLKSELKLRPTYDEMIGMIEAQGDPNRLSIETVIDRRATIFRNNQFGSQLDNIDFFRSEEARGRQSKRKFKTSAIKTSRNRRRNINRYNEP